MAGRVFCSVGMPGFEPGAPCPPDKYSNRAELHPVILSGAKLINYSGFPKKAEACYAA